MRLPPRLGRPLALLAGLLLASCAPSPPVPDALKLDRARFADLPGWTEDDPAAALPALIKSCRAMSGRKDDQPVGLDLVAGDWRALCAEAATVAPDQARAFFERRFVPFRASNHGITEGLFTGYYEAELKGALQPDATFATPLYKRPPDLVQVDLGQFRPSLKGERIAGKVENGRLVPYADRAAIEAGALADKDLELAWVDDPVDAFFLEIQGSGRLTLTDGSTVRVGFDGQNGWPYVAIGRVLADQGVPKDDITMPFLRRWIAEHGAEGRALMDKNPSYVFFKELKGDGPIGAEGVVLTPGRSVAVDRGFLALGVPVWIDTTDPVEPGGRLKRLFLAQDTGGAIRGPVRADLFFGYGKEAAEHAGLMKGRGSLWVLLPAEAAARR
ncbi:MAG TPA: MltA domain-containing protein [Aliidongia sp.]|nr:MltA domain-containing protein [Aliidongia sp.]